MKRLNAKTGHGSFEKLKTVLTPAKKWQPSFDGSLTQIIKRCKLCSHHSYIIDTEVTHFKDVVQVETIDSEEESPGHILMTDLFSGFTIATTPSSMDAHTVIDTFFSLWVIGLNGDWFGITSKCVYTSSGRKLDKKEGRELCEELKLTWKYPKLGKVITLSPDCKVIFQDLKVISPAVLEDILLAEAAKAILRQKMFSI